MVRWAIPVEGGQVAPHLGHCEFFMMVELEDGKVQRTWNVPNPGHGPGGPPPHFLAREGVSHVLAWGMPPHAQGLFRQVGISFVLGATGDPGKVLADYLAGSLTLSSEGLDAGGGCGSHH